MKKKQENQCCSLSSGGGSGRTRVESLITVDERGQTVLPKEVREKAGIRSVVSVKVEAYKPVAG